jgi:DNA-binding transcriptional LysR family regulator
VQELEHTLGVHLFDRIGRRVHLSQAGEVLAGHARRLFALAHEIEDPFGPDPNRLPVDALCATIARDAADLAADPQSPGSD